jgi:hypothetical protein
LGGLDGQWRLHVTPLAWLGLDGDIKVMHVFVFCQADSSLFFKKKRKETVALFLFI